MSNSFLGKPSRAPRLSRSSNFVIVPVRAVEADDEGDPIYINLVLTKGQTIDMIDQLTALVEKIGKEVELPS